MGAVNGAGFVVENDGNFTTLTGVTNAPQSLNLRIGNTYVALNHGLLINSALIGVDQATENIVPVTGFGDGLSYTSEIDSTFTCLLGDEQHLLRDMTSNILVENFYSGTALFKPVKHIFQVNITDTNAELIENAMTGALYNDNRNYGYLSYTDEEGTARTGFLLSMTRSPVKGIATIETVERA